uniref:Uncharacterized protein n=1 Tax=Lutzomyia longipalpis TaxID=7200 RepID=A0A1B0GGY5_LUTLO
MESRHSIKHRVALLTDQRLFGHPCPRDGAMCGKRDAGDILYMLGIVERACCAIALLWVLAMEAWLHTVVPANWLLVRPQREEDALPLNRGAESE